MNSQQQQQQQQQQQKRKTKMHKKLKGLLCELLNSKHSVEKEKQLIQKNIGAILLQRLPGI
jgi:hypothetical protein